MWFDKGLPDEAEQALLRALDLNPGLAVTHMRYGGLLSNLERYDEAVLERRRAVELDLDPGVLCPNSSLEAIAWKAPSSPRDLNGLPELKRWFVREFAAEVTEASQAGDGDRKD